VRAWDRNNGKVVQWMPLIQTMHQGLVRKGHLRRRFLRLNRATWSEPRMRRRLLLKPDA